MFTDAFDNKPRPVQVNSGKRNGLAAIEQRFSRIAQELATRWNRDDIDAYLNALMLDDRGNRQGFPADVLEELMFLSNLRWQLQHPSFSRADEGLVEQFTFNPVSRLDSRYCESNHTWILA
ncbi:MAG: hypothetical protein Q8Q28_10015 [Pseudomonadota bacterium]|nr:hypothetical protein [Pseudomonadota bacterium]